MTAQVQDGNGKRAYRHSNAGLPVPVASYTESNSLTSNPGLFVRGPITGIAFKLSSNGFDYVAHSNVKGILATLIYTRRDDRHQVVSISLRGIPERMNPFPVPSTYSKPLEDRSDWEVATPFILTIQFFLNPTAVVRVS